MGNTEFHFIVFFKCLQLASIESLYVLVDFLKWKFSCFTRLYQFQVFKHSDSVFLRVICHQIDLKDNGTITCAMQYILTAYLFDTGYILSKVLVVTDSVRPHGLQPTRLLCSWASPCKYTGGGLPFPSPFCQKIFPNQFH